MSFIPFILVFVPVVAVQLLKPIKGQSRAINGTYETRAYKIKK